MAKREKVSKGFGFYLFMFILILIAVFMVVVGIMIFSPGKTILGFKYIKTNDQVSVTEDSSGVKINFDKLSNVNIKTQHASVVIARSDSETGSLTITSKVTGFARGGDQEKLEYNVTYDNAGILTVETKEPTGFLNFNYDLKVILNYPNTEDINNTLISEIAVTTENGNITIGNSNEIKEDQYLYIGNLKCTTTSGSVRVTDRVRNLMNTIDITTQSGGFTTDKKTFEISGLNVVTKSGRIAFNDLQFRLGNPRVNVGDGSFSASSVNCASKAFVFDARNGRLNIGTLKGTLSSNSSEEINKASINVDYVNGGVGLTNIKNTNVNIGRIDGEINISATGGNINVGKDTGLDGGVCQISTESGSITALVANTTYNHTFKTNSGQINVTYQRFANNGTETLISKSGNVTAYIGSGFQFILNLKNAAGELRENMNKVSIDFIKESEYQNPLRVNNYAGTDRVMDIKTDGAIAIKLTNKTN